MKYLLRSLLLPLVFGGTITYSTPALAIPIVRQISQTQAQGLIGGGAIVSVWSGSGTNIDFTRTGETIQRAWLDDPHAVVVDFDAPPGGRGNASVVHLKRVTGIRFPNLPQTRSTLLTVITRSSSGPKTYLFEVRYGSGTPQYASLVVTPDLRSFTATTSAGETDNWNAVERGMQRAIAQRLLTPNSPVIARVQTFLSSVRNGTPMQQAAQQSGVSLPVLSRLAELGQSVSSSPESSSQ